MGANQKDSSFAFISYCTSVQIKWSQRVQQNPTGCLHFYFVGFCFVWFFPQNTPLHWFVIFQLLNVGPWPVLVCGSSKVQRNLEQSLAKRIKKHLPFEKGSDTTDLSLPLSNREPHTLESLPQNCDSICQYRAGRANFPAPYTDTGEGVVLQTLGH